MSEEQEKKKKKPKTEKTKKTKKTSWAQPPKEDGEDTSTEEEEQQEPFEVVALKFLERIAVALEEGNKLYKEAMQSNSVPSSKTSAPSVAKPEKTEKTKSEPTGESVEQRKNLFTPELQGLLIFSEDENYVLVKPARYLGSENFARIAAIVRDNGGEYVSAGKESHFRFPKK